MFASERFQGLGRSGRPPGLAVTNGQHAVSDADRLHIIEDIRLAIHPVDGDHQLLTHRGTVALTSGATRLAGHGVSGRLRAAG